MADKQPLLVTQRKIFHEALIKNGILAVNEKGVPTNADSSNSASIRVAAGIAEQLVAETHERAAGQTSGAKFETVVADYVALTFPMMEHLRPGKWTIIKLGNRSSKKASSFIQYEHLSYLDELTRENKRLSAMIGNDYMVAPDIVVYRDTYSDEELNRPIEIVNQDIATLADLRASSNDSTPILHASISAKWTMRSDRAQNSRTEALNLIRNRKGRLPHIMVVTGEPLPSRLASIALGTGDIDCTYHFALYELIESVRENGTTDAWDMLMTLIEGKRLKDISDMPLDLAV